MVRCSAAWRNRGLSTRLAAGSSCGPVDDQPLVGKLTAPHLKVVLSTVTLVGVGVPLLSQEGPTCRLLPGATAPYPALDQELTKFSAVARMVKFPAAARGCFGFVETALVAGWWARKAAPVGVR